MININNLQKFDWFAEIGTDEYSRDIVYVHYMNIDIINYIQSYNKNLLIHFFVSKIKKEKYVSNIYLADTDRDPYSDLNGKLFFLQKSYSKNFILDIFYEIHDGKNAITNLSAILPEVYEELYKLYNVYGFDHLYERLR